MLSPLETFRMAWDALSGRKLRSALTLLGIVIGVFSVIASVTAVQVVENTFVSTLSQMGSTTFTVTRVSQFNEPTREQRQRRQLTVEQGLRLRERAALPAAVGLSMAGTFSAEVRGGGEQTNPNVVVYGADEHYAANNGLTIADGRFLTNDDVQYGRPVAVLGQSVAERLFGGREALGREVRVDGHRYRVIGTLDEQSGGFGMFDPNNMVVIPLPRLLAVYSYASTFDVTIDVRAPSVELLDATRDEVIGDLRAIRRVAPEDESDFELSSSEALIGGVRTFTNALALGGAGIGLIALLAAGVGVMNIMLVSVTERTREIGIRKAVGATRSAILRQFLLEAVLLCQVGGLIGITLGALGGNVVALLLNDAPAFPWGWAVLAVVGMVGVAVTFGVYPAWKAASLRPIDALRYE